MFSSKKAARDAGLLSRDEWFRKFRCALRGEPPTIIKGEEFFSYQQTEELFSKSKGNREIGLLRSGAIPVGRKRLPRRSVRYDVYRESDFEYRPKVFRKMVPPRKVHPIVAITAVQNTANRYAMAARKSQQLGDGRRARSFRKRQANLIELANRGLRAAIEMDLVDGCHRSGSRYEYYGDGFRCLSDLEPPLSLNTCTGKLPHADSILSLRDCRLKDAVYTLEQLLQSGIQISQAVGARSRERAGFENN